MRALQVEIEINGVFVHVGTLYILQPQQAEAVFAYDASWPATECFRQLINITDN